MNIHDAIILFFTLATLAALPSTSVALVVTRSATIGIADGIATASGIVAGDLVFVLLALFGLSVMINTLGSLFLIIKYLGGAYLIWTGVTLWLSHDKTDMALKQRPVRNLLTSFLAGLVLTMGDVKAILFYISLLPLFIDNRSVDLRDTAMILAITVLAVGSVKISYAVLATKIARTRLNQTMATFLKRIAAACMIGAGGFLIIAG